MLAPATAVTAALDARRPLPPGSRRILFGAGNEQLWLVALVIVAIIVLIVLLRRRNR